MPGKTHLIIQKGDSNLDPFRYYTT